MSGNVEEYCWDWSAAFPGTSTNYTGPATGSYRVIHGGSHDYIAYNVRVGYRNIVNPFFGNVNLGFRFARTY
jgi:formylglycine-generating enzyme required for sulfatase activity